MNTFYDVIEKLEELARKWENTSYTGDLTQAARISCANELRTIIGTPTENDERVYKIS